MHSTATAYCQQKGLLGGTLWYTAARMDELPGVTFQRAARELRAHMQRSQQVMATFMGLSMAALRNYESGAVVAPDARAATAYMLTAEAAGRPDLVKVFGSALHRALGIPEFQSLADMMRAGTPEQTISTEPMNPFEMRMVTTLLACIRGQGPFKEHQESVLKGLIEPSALMSVFPESLRFLKKDSLQDQEALFEKVVAARKMARQKHQKSKTIRSRKERVSA